MHCTFTYFILFFYSLQTFQDKSATYASQSSRHEAA